MAKENNGTKATIREVYDLVKPMNESITKIETLLTTHLGNYEKDCEENKTEHKSFNNRFANKISIKAFASWLTGAGLFITMILALLKFLKVM